ncbi:MAG: TfoX/Sxy family protein [Cytophagales bacterium]|nr:TfoX/Sxy family protein [Cytophagales bacterium]
MAYNEKLADRIREALQHLPSVEEKIMFKGVTFMVDGKMCISVSGEELMVRFDPALQETVAEKHGFRTMVMKGKMLKGYGYIDADCLCNMEDFNFWISLALEFNNRAKASRKK